MLTHFLKNARGGVAPLMAVVAVPFHSVCRTGALPREAYCCRCRHACGGSLCSRAIQFVQHDRYQPDQAARRSIVAAQRWQTKSPARKSRALHSSTLKQLYADNAHATRLTSPSSEAFQTACRSPWRGRHKVHRSWRPSPQTPHRQSWRIRSVTRSPCRAT